ncbi:MAG: hypothetical protein COB02_16045 [Candidatus Cloacimonadota bacterium]|nr:MAG: hypothetical protein COB02_16045 [Candidatus Cloacimonadota bacterium]
MSEEIDHKRSIKSNYNIHHVLARIANKLICAFTMTDCEIIGEENLQNLPRPYVLVANHCSNWDPLVLSAYFPDVLNFMIKKDLHDIRNFGAMSTLSGNIVVSKGGIDLEAIKGATFLLKNGYNLALFPEGTRSKTGRIEGFKDVGVGIASKCKVPIVPVYIKKTYDILKKGDRLPKGGVAQIHILPAVMTTCESGQLECSEINDINQMIYQSLKTYEKEISFKS